MTWLSRLRTRLEPPAGPRLTSLVAIATPEPSSTERDARLVRDMAAHVSAKVLPIVDMHGRTMETAAQSNVMAIEVSLRLGLEAAQRSGLCALCEGADLAEAQAKVDVAIDTLVEGLASHRAAVSATLEAVSLGLAGGQVRDNPRVRS